MPTERAALADIIGPTRQTVESIVWCTVTTVGEDNAPRSRIMHPVWFFDQEVPYAFVTARPTPLKRRHLAANPAVSCSYWDPQHHTVVIDATAGWLDGSEIAGAWALISDTPPPIGFDPAMIWPDGPASDGCAILRFDANRIVTTLAGRPGLLWSRRPAIA
jgi:hypothetical protein